MNLTLMNWIVTTLITIVFGCLGGWIISTDHFEDKTIYDKDIVSLGKTEIS